MSEINLQIENLNSYQSRSTRC